MKYLLLPYQLIAEFAWDWLAVHYWTSRFIIVNTMLLSVLEGCALWRLWTRARIRYAQSHIDLLPTVRERESCCYEAKRGTAAATLVNMHGSLLNSRWFNMPEHFLCDRGK